MASFIPSRLKEREEARRATQEQRKAERKEGKRVEETSDHFNQELEAKKNIIRSLLDDANTLPKGDLPSHFEKISSEAQLLQKYISDSTVFITAYDLKTAQQQIRELLQLVNSKQNELIPKKKFAFSSRKKEAAQSDPIEKEEETTLKKEDTVAALAVSSKSKSLRDKENEDIEMKSDEVRGHDVILSCLRDCRVKFCGASSSIHMTELKNCKIFSGPVSGSIFLENCRDCVFVLACQQLRIHGTFSSQFHLHVTSTAIIEDSRELTFAPYCWSYPQIQDDYEFTGMSESVNNWDKVKDFNWLSSHDPSPNWRVLPLDQRTISMDTK